jgi:hypothetical protein
MRIFKHNFLFPIWGEKYIENFNNFALNCLIKNLKLVERTQLDKININFWTLKKDIRLFKNLENIKALNNLVNVRYLPIDYLLDNFNKNVSKYLFLSTLQSLFLSESTIKKYDYSWFIYPDFIFNNDLIINIIKKINKNNYEAVFLPVPQIVEEELKKILFKSHISKIIPNIKFILQDHIHPIVSNCNINKLKTNTPSMFMVSKKDEFILFRYFHIHPLVVKLNLDAEFIFNEMSSSLDQDLVKNFKNKNIYCVNSDKIGICISLLKLKEIKLYETQFKLLNTCTWIINNTNKSHLNYVKKNYLIKYKNFNLKSFNKQKDKLNSHIEKILKEIKKKKYFKEKMFNNISKLFFRNNNEILFLKRELHRQVNFNKISKRLNLKEVIDNFFRNQKKTDNLKYLKTIYK